MLDIIILAVTALLNLLIGLVVYLKNPRGATNRLFFGLAAVFVLWSTVNYISVHPFFFAQIIWVRLVLFCGALLNLSVFLTFLAFPATNLDKKYYRRVKLAIISTVLVMPLTLTPLVFRTLKVSHGSASPVPAPAIVLFLVQTLALVGLSISTIVGRYRHSTGRSRDQLRMVILGLSGTFGLIILSDFILVAFFKVTALIPFGSAFTLIFSSSFAYAIIRHRLFDIRRAAARGVGYVLTIASMAAVYSLLVFGISSLFLTSRQIDSRVQLVYTTLALLLAFSFQPIKRFFDKISNRFFFKDAYEPQVFIDDLNRVLVTQVELNPLLANSITIINKFLKSAGSSFAIRSTDNSPLRIISSAGIQIDEPLVESLKPKLIRFHQKVIITDYIETIDDELYTELEQHNIAAVVRLLPNLSLNSSSVGDIFLGPKRSGDTYSKQDIQMLDIIANELVLAIQNAIRFEEIKNFNETLQAKVTDATRQLRRSNEKLKELDETKDDFISMASHQLRTPLTSVKGYISMVLEEDAGAVTPLQKEMLGQAFFSSQRMVYLIADLLNVSRLKNGKFIIESAPVNLADVVEQELSQLKETAAARKLTLEYVKPTNFPTLTLDETKTRQVIMNFVDNAIYYTPDGGQIKVELSETDQNVELRVVDNGIGVPRSQQPHLFTKFYRADNARKARPDGTGLGLFMAKKVIVAEGGSLIFDSKEGEGSTFGFSFSKARLGVPNEAAVPASSLAIQSVKSATKAKPVAKPRSKPLKAIAK